MNRGGACFTVVGKDPSMQRPARAIWGSPSNSSKHNMRHMKTQILSDLTIQLRDLLTASYMCVVAVVALTCLGNQLKVDCTCSDCCSFTLLLEAPYLDFPWMLCCLAVSVQLQIDKRLVQRQHDTTTVTACV